jgi:hypothetical protein
MQRWEYLALTRKRNKGIINISSWKEDVVPQLPKLGEDGWELVAVSPHAGIIGASGTTTEELWVFKRPKS